MPVETRAQIRARELAEKGPAGSVGSRAASKKTVAESTEPVAAAAPKKKKAPAAAAAKKKPAARNTAAAGSRKKRMSVEGPLDTIVVDLVRSLPLEGVKEGDEKEEKKPKAAKEKVVKEKKEKVVKEKTVSVVVTSGRTKRGAASVEREEVQVPVEEESITIALAPTKAQKKAATVPSPAPPPPSVAAAATAPPTQGLDGSTTEDEFETDVPAAATTTKAPSLPFAPRSAPQYVDAYPDMPSYDRAERISGYVVYRTDYSHSPAEWARYKEVLMHHFRTQEAKAGKESEDLQLVWMEDEGLFGNGDLDFVREEFDKWCREKNPELDQHGEDSHYNYFPAGPFQDYTSSFCLVADRLSISTTLGLNTTAAPTILILQRNYIDLDHEDEIADTPGYALIPEDPKEAFDPAKFPPGFDPRELVKEAVGEGEKVVWAGYRGWFRAGVDMWMHLEPEAQGSWEFWAQYFAVNAARSSTGAWTLLEGGVLE